MLTWILLVAAALILFGIGDCVYCMTRFRKKRFTLRDKRIRKPFRFVLLTDLHGRCYGTGNRKLLRAIEEEHPDAVFIAGDMITATTEGDYEAACELCVRLAEQYPVYYTLGNHEQKWKERARKFGRVYEEYEEKLKAAGVRILENAHAVLPESGITVYGLCLNHNKYYKRFSPVPMETDYLKGLLGEPEKGSYRIVLAHNPDYFPFYGAWGADLVLSGHVHGGIVNVPFLGGAVSPSLKLFPKYDAGLFEEGEAKMILSRGLGTHTLPVRVFNPAELVCVELLPEKS